MSHEAGDREEAAGDAGLARVSVFFDRISGEYDRLISSAGDEWIRAAFRALVVRTAPAGGDLLDFGCGTGLDAKSFAEAGFRVSAWDVAPGMRARVRSNCAPLIAAGKVVPLDAEPEGARFDAIAANFAVLNLNRDLAPIFDSFARWLVPGGKVVASLLNPLYWRELAHPIAWRAIPRGLTTGRIDVPSPEVATFRHFPHAVARAAAPGFRLLRTEGAGLLVDDFPARSPGGAPRPLFARIETALAPRSPFGLIAKYRFVVLERR